MRVLLAYDGSPDAAKAVELTAAMAWPAGSTVRVVSVIDPPMVALSPWAGAVADYPSAIDAEITSWLQGEVDAAVERLKAPERTVEGAVLRGRPASVVVDEAEAFAADLVIVGSRGHGSISSLILGSVSGEVVDHAPCPVLVARGPAIAGVVFGTDSSPSSSTAERLLAEWPIFATIPIRVVSVADVVEPWRTGIAPTMYAQVAEAHAKDLAQARSEHQAIVDRSAERLRAAGRDASAELRTGDAASEIIAAADERRADLIVLGSRGRTGLARLLLGSVARNVVHGSRASILVVRGATAVGADQDATAE